MAGGGQLATYRTAILATKALSAILVEDPARTSEYDDGDDGAHYEIGVGRTSPGDQHSSSDHVEIGDNVVGGKYVTCFHMRPPITFLGDQNQTGSVSNESYCSNAHHQSRFGFAAKEDASNHFTQRT